MANFTVSNINDSGSGSLRQALLDANALAGRDIITFASSLIGQTISLVTGELIISDDLILDGDLDNDGTADITLDAGGSSRVLKIDDGNSSPDKDIAIVGLTISGGRTVQALEGGGGIQSFENLILVNSAIRNNSTAGRESLGGGIFSQGGNLEIFQSEVSNNFTEGELSGGGGVAARGTDSLSGNTLIIDKSTIDGNWTIGTRANGGGIAAGYNTGSDTPLESLLITNSTISNNEARDTELGGRGGGLFTNTQAFSETAEIINSTFSGNLAAGEFGAGGGIYNNFGGMAVRNTTITNNAAAAGRGAGFGSLNLTGFASSGTIIFESNIIAGNVDTLGNASTDIDEFLASGRDSAIVSSGNNLVGFGNASGEFDQPGDINEVSDPGLAPLANNGGQTKTHALLENSPAVNAGSNPDGLTTDQRGEGFDRVVNGSPDIGAFESQFGAPPNSPPDANDDSVITDEDNSVSGNLLTNDFDNDLDALTVVEVNGEAANIGTETTLTSGALLTVEANGSFLYNPNGQFDELNDGEIATDSFNYTASDPAGDSDTAVVNITINGRDELDEAVTLVTNTNDSGPGSLRQAIENANNPDSADNNLIEFAEDLIGQIINLTSGELSIIDDLTIDGDIDNDGIADITVDGGGRSRIFRIDDDNGTPDKEIIIEGVNITNGSAFLGGGGLLNSENTTVINSSISGNVTDNVGGGIINEGGDLTLINSWVEDNLARGIEEGGEIFAGFGGGIYNEGGDLTLINSRVANNTAQIGGGIDSSNGTLELTDSTVEKNIATGLSGGGIASSSDELSIHDSSILGNWSDNNGGGITIGGNTNALIFRTIIDGNESLVGGGVINFGDTVIVDSTISNNVANGSGAGVVNDEIIIISNSTIIDNAADPFGTSNFPSSGGGVVTFSSAKRTELNNTTITGNSADSGGGVDTRAGTFNIRNTIVAGNTATTNPDLLARDGATIEARSSLIQNDADQISNADPSNILGQDPLLDPAGLRDNGGPTQTIALQANSPAINGGNNFFIPADLADQNNDGNVEEPTPFDQRGVNFNRVVDNTVDIGAFESQDVGESPPQVNGQDATSFVGNNGLLQGNVFGAGSLYTGDLFSDTDGTANPDDVIAGTPGDDNIWGGSEGNDLIDAGEGNDTVGFGDGDASVDAGSGDDVVYAAGNGDGVNIIDLGSGEDSFWAPAGDNTITGTDNNTIGIGTGNDTVTTGDGNDLVYSVNGGGGVNILDLGEGNNTVSLENGDHIISTGSGDDILGFGKGEDTVNAGDGDNIIYMIAPEGTNDGDKDILTGIGNDWVQTGSGNDRLDLGTNAGGDTGFDFAFGQDGNDIFVLNLGSGWVTVGDFTQGEDVLEISDIDFSDIGFSVDAERGSSWVWDNVSGDVKAELQGFTGTLTEADFMAV